METKRSVTETTPHVAAIEATLDARERTLRQLIYAARQGNVQAVRGFALAYVGQQLGYAGLETWAAATRKAL